MKQDNELKTWLKMGVVQSKCIQPFDMNYFITSYKPFGSWLLISQMYVSMRTETVISSANNLYQQQEVTGGSFYQRRVCF
jgi:hypothetical protein